MPTHAIMIAGHKYCDHSCYMRISLVELGKVSHDDFISSLLIDRFSRIARRIPIAREICEVITSSK